MRAPRPRVTKLNAQLMSTSSRFWKPTTVQRIAISGDRAAATLSRIAGVDLETVQLRRTATGEWLIDKLGPLGSVASPGLMPCMHRRASCR